LPKREAFAVLALPILVALILWAPAWVFLVVLGAVVVAAGDELLVMAGALGASHWRWLTLASLAGLLAASWAAGLPGLAIALAAVVTVLPAAQLARPEAPRSGLSGVAASCLTVFFLGLTGACLGWLRLWPHPAVGAKLLLLYLGVIWAGDSGAYYVGTRLGRHKMSPRISPNKTWEGLAGGTVVTFLAAAVLQLLLDLPMPWIHVLAVSAILAVAAPLGDLVESQFKRDAGVKDSSRLFPGHGGALDRTDSLIYPAPAVLGYLMLVGLVP
jgi:phosphatidate cytidylyltransferase